MHFVLSNWSRRGADGNDCDGFEVSRVWECRRRFGNLGRHGYTRVRCIAGVVGEVDVWNGSGSFWGRGVVKFHRLSGEVRVHDWGVWVFCVGIHCCNFVAAFDCRGRLGIRSEASQLREVLLQA